MHLKPLMKSVHHKLKFFDNNADFWFTVYFKNRQMIFKCPTLPVFTLLHISNKWLNYITVLLKSWSTTASFFLGGG